MDLRDSPCIFSGSNGHVPPLIEGGRGVELPGEIRGNELKVTRARETFSSLSLSFSFRTPRFSLVGTTLAHQQNFSPLHRRYHHQATTGSLTTTRDTSITEISTLSLPVAIRIKRNEGKETDLRERIIANPFESAFSHDLVRIHTRTRVPGNIFSSISAANEAAYVDIVILAN